MKKILSIVLCSLIGHLCFAGPVDPDLLKTIRLADGEVVTVRMVGDEYFSYLKDVNSERCFVKDADSNEYVLMGQSDKSKRHAVAAETRRESNKSRIRRTPFYECVGERKMLAVLVDFKDKTFNNDNISKFYRIFNEKGLNEGRLKGSVKDYFTEQSNGKFSPSFDVVGPVKLAHNSAYYGSNEGGLDKKSREMIEEIYAQLKSTVDWKKYDWDGDGTAEPLCVVYAGYAEELGGTENDIWCHASNLTTDAMERCNNTLYRYTLTSELRNVSGEPMANGIGTICHELSHTFGLPDFYDGNDKFYGGQRWDVMSTGVHNDNGFRPAGYTSLDKMMMGWQEPIELKGSQVINNMEPLSKRGNFYRVINDAFPSEFYLIENRQKTGVWDSQLPSSGVLIWHVDYSNFIFQVEESVNNSKDSSREHMALFLSDNNWEHNTFGGDAYPYNGNNSLTNTSSPSAMLWHANVDGKYLMNKPITNIHCNADGTAGFTFTNNVGTVPAAIQPTDIKCDATGYLAQYFFNFDIKDLKITGTINPRDFRFIFSELTQLESLDLQDCDIINNEGKVGVLGNQTFLDNKTLVDIRLPKLKEMGRWAFARSTKLKNIVMQEGFSTIPYCAFYKCDKLEEAIIPQGVTTIDEYAFADCTSLASVSIPNTVSSIKKYAFSGCNNLTSIDLPELVEVIDTFAFRDCNLSKIEIPANVKAIKYVAFWGNKNVKEVVCKSIVPPTCGEFCFANETYSNATLYVPSESLDAYKSANTWSKFKKISTIENKTAIADASAEDLISIEGNTIRINSAYRNVEVYNVNGIRQDITPSSANSYTLPQGIYIISIDGRSKKIRI